MIGSDPLKMPAGIKIPGLLDYRYDLVDMHQVDCVGLLMQDDPKALVLAVLCDFGEQDPGQVVTHIVHRLRALLGADERGFRNYMEMLEVLSENRNLKAQVEETERMLTRIEIERMPSFVIDYERGEAEGETRGKTEGKAIGEAQIVRLLVQRVGLAKAAESLGLSPEEVERIAASGADSH